jgi:putative toxin-antitoxin system toxin component, PIN family
MLKVVLDTNVVVSAHLKASGREALILDLGLSSKYQLCVSELLLEEYEGVLLRRRFGLPVGKVRQSILVIRNASQIVTPKQTLDVASDPDDNKILECALEAGAGYVVTGNVRHFPSRFRNIRIVLPRQFLTILAAELELP